MYKFWCWLLGHKIVLLPANPSYPNEVTVFCTRCVGRKTIDTEGPKYIGRGLGDLRAIFPQAFDAPTQSTLRTPGVHF